MTNNQLIKEQIETIAKKSLERTLDFYAERGITLNTLPSIKYVNAPNAFRPDALASVSPELEFAESISNYFVENMAKYMWRTMYGIEVSDDAFRELLPIFKRKMLPILTDSFPLNSRESITFYEPFKEYVNDQMAVDAITAHEVWHLVEDERGLRILNPLIVEGTATYAGRKRINERCDESPESCSDPIQLFYNGAANIVQRFVDGKDNHYLEMLNPNCREVINEKFLQVVKPKMIAFLEEMIKQDDVRADMLDDMTQIPEFKQLKGNMSAGGIIVVYRKLGANKLADEIEGQDLSKLVEFYKQVGF